MLALIATAYVALPYVTLYRLGAAIRDGDAASLETLVDWDEVREGLKEDICDAMAEQADAPTEQVAGQVQELPAFGSGFMRGIAVNMIDQAVSAGALVTATRTPPSSLKVAQTAEPDAQPRITWAFFDSLTSFGVELLPPGASTPVRIELSLRHGEWQVTHAWLPPEMLTPQADRT
jgi:hypothetical protein